MTRAARTCLLAFALLSNALACVSGEELQGCAKDTDCAEGRICEDRVCTWTDGAPEAPACTDTGESCAVNGDCCSYESDGGYCVNGVCADACADASECVSGCCARLDGGGFACAPAAVCSKACAPAGDPCSVNADCCRFQEAGTGYCVDGVCADGCAQHGECASNCCAALQSGEHACAPEYICQ